MTELGHWLIITRSRQCGWRVVEWRLNTKKPEL